MHEAKGIIFEGMRFGEINFGELKAAPPSPVFQNIRGVTPTDAPV
jgi:hypothetical protein